MTIMSLSDIPTVANTGDVLNSKPLPINDTMLSIPNHLVSAQTGARFTNTPPPPLTKLMFADLVRG